MGRAVLGAGSVTGVTVQHYPLARYVGPAVIIGVALLVVLTPLPGRVLARSGVATPAATGDHLRQQPATR